MTLHLTIAFVLAGCGGGARETAAPHEATAGDAQHEHHHDGGMLHRFENADEWAKVFDDPARDAWQKPDTVIAALDLSPAMVVADIGAGTGYFSVRLARGVPDGRVIATDIEPDMIRYLKQRATREHVPNLEAVLTPPADPQLAKASLDRVLVVDVWHHLGDRIAYARALANALRPGGRIAIVDFKLDATHGPPPEHRLTAAQIAADLTAAGLTASVSSVVLPEQYIVIGQL
jgi:cyclopropane fatty-acyl-phospholipid synthase-like methyltransferase